MQFPTNQYTWLDSGFLEELASPKITAHLAGPVASKLNLSREYLFSAYFEIDTWILLNFQRFAEFRMI